MLHTYIISKITFLFHFLLLWCRTAERHHGITCINCFIFIMLNHINSYKTCKNLKWKNGSEGIVQISMCSLYERIIACMSSDITILNSTHVHAALEYLIFSIHHPGNAKTCFLLRISRRTLLFTMYARFYNSDWCWYIDWYSSFDMLKISYMSNNSISHSKERE